MTLFLALHDSFFIIEFMKLPCTDKRKNYRLVPPGGKFALPESKGRSLAESIAWRMWEKSSKRQIIKPQAKRLTVEQVSVLYLDWADRYYRRQDRERTSEYTSTEIALRYLRSAFGNKLMDDVSYHDILDVRQEILKAGKNTRKTIKKYFRLTMSV